MQEESIILIDIEILENIQINLKIIKIKWEKNCSYQ
jgi:hypothetical protein